MIFYVLAMGKQHLEPHVVAGYGIKIFWPSLFHYVTRSPGWLYTFIIILDSCQLCRPLRAKQQREWPNSASCEKTRTDDEKFLKFTFRILRCVPYSVSR